MIRALKIAFPFVCLWLFLAQFGQTEWRNDAGTDELFTYTTLTSTITIPQTAGRRNCITELTVSGEFGLLYTIYDGPLNSGSTIYSVATASGTPVYEHWDVMNPLCGNVNSTTTVRASLTNGSRASYNNYRINVTGYKRIW